MSTKKTPVSLIRALIVIDRGRKRQKSSTGFNLVFRVVGLLVLLSILATGLVIGVGVGTAAAAYNTITGNLPTPDDVAEVGLPAARQRIGTSPLNL